VLLPEGTGKILYIWSEVVAAETRSEEIMTARFAGHELVPINASQLRIWLIFCLGGQA